MKHTKDYKSVLDTATGKVTSIAAERNDDPFGTFLDRVTEPLMALTLMTGLSPLLLLTVGDSLQNVTAATPSGQLNEGTRPHLTSAAKTSLSPAPM